MNQIFTAKIKVKGNDSGFIPTEVDMRIDKSRFTIKLKARSRLNMSRRRMQNLSIELDEFERCVIEIDEEDDGVHEEEDNLKRNNDERHGRSNKEGNRTDMGELGDENIGNKDIGAGVVGIIDSKPGLHFSNRKKKLGNQDLLKKGEIRRDNGSVQLFSNKTKGRRITVLRGDGVLSDSSDEEKGKQLDVDMESEGKAHEEDELYQTEGREVLDGQVEDFQIHDEGKLQADDEFFDKMIQQEGTEDVENVKESDIEEYRTEEDECFEEDSDVGTSILFKDPNPASTEHVSCTPESEQGNTKEGGIALLSTKNQPAPLSSFIHSKSGNISPILPPSSNLCMHLSNLHNRDPTDKRAVSVADPKLILNSGNETHDTFQMNVCQSESDAPINHPTELAGVDGRVLVDVIDSQWNVLRAHIQDSRDFTEWLDSIKSK
ncbi:hypothetical protein LguiB_021215 [Lonicera macranthoides]